MFSSMKINLGFRGFVIAAMLGAVTANGWSQDDAAETEPPKVIGVEMQRQDGRYLGLAVEGNAFVIRFYDRDKKEEPVDVVRATARWRSPQKAGQQRTVLNPNGMSLRSPPVVRPPLVFSAFVSLIDHGGEVSESFNFNLQLLKSAKSAEKENSPSPVGL